MKIELKRVDDAFSMEARDEAGNAVIMDAPASIGGNERGVRPMQMLIMGLGGCAAVDVLLILKKQKQIVEDFRISIAASRQTDKEPALWEEIQLTFHFSGKVEQEKAARAVSLSMKKYCSVAATLEKAGAKITFHILVNEPA